MKTREKGQQEFLEYQRRKGGIAIKDHPKNVLYRVGAISFVCIYHFPTGQPRIWTGIVSLYKNTEEDDRFFRYPPHRDLSSSL
jgi:hypothetical protein